MLSFSHLKKPTSAKRNKRFFFRRVAARNLGVGKGTVIRWCRELIHYGFIVQVRGASFGPGRGRAAEFRLTDERYKGKPPTKDFTCWDGTSFCDLPYAKLGRKPGLPYQKLGHSRTKMRTENPESPIIPVRKMRTHLEEDSSHLSSEERQVTEARQT